MGSGPDKQRRQEKQSDDVDSVSFFEILEIIFEGKRLILLTTFLFSCLGLGVCAFLANQVSFSSKVEFLVENSLSERTTRRIGQSWGSIFEKKFFDSAVFGNWQNEAKNSALNFEEINVYATIDGYRFYDPSKSLINHSFGGGNLVLSISSSEPAKIFAIFDYSKVVAKSVEATVVAELNAASSVIKEKEAYAINLDSDFLEFFSIQSYETSTLISLWQRDGISFFAPTKPEATPRNYVAIFLISTFSGFGFACFLVLLIDAKRRFDRSLS